MKRREFITLLGGAAATYPLAARAQNQAMPVIGFLNLGSPALFAHLVAAFRAGLSEGGYVEGQNATIEYRWANAQAERLPEMAADLVRRQVAVIVAAPNGPALASKAATTEISIVFCVGSDPVITGLVASLNRPGGNLTGVNYFTSELGAKRLGLLRELLPRATRIAALINSNAPSAGAVKSDLLEAARTVGLEIQLIVANSNREIDSAFATLVKTPVDALLVVSDPLFFNRRVQLVTLAARHAVATIYPSREYAEIGGLLTYGTNLADAYRQAGVYAARILKGSKPVDLPVVQSAKFEFVINAATARALDLEIPPTLLARADEVIE